jgi:DNA-directed RNA polymerase specialized sigma24 family protein
MDTLHTNRGYTLDTKKLSYAEIGRLLNRDERNIWTVYQRAKKKVE